MFNKEYCFVLNQTEFSHDGSILYNLHKKSKGQCSIFFE